jgi:hypothetical protein
MVQILRQSPDSALTTLQAAAAAVSEHTSDLLGRQMWTMAACARTLGVPHYCCSAMSGMAAACKPPACTTVATAAIVSVFAPKRLVLAICAARAYSTATTGAAPTLGWPNSGSVGSGAGPQASARNVQPASARGSDWLSATRQVFSIRPSLLSGLYPGYQVCGEFQTTDLCLAVHLHYLNSVCCQGTGRAMPMCSGSIVRTNDGGLRFAF